MPNDPDQTSPAAPTPPPRNLQQDLGEVSLLRARKQLSEAIGKCSQVLAQYGEQWEALELMGDLLVENGDEGQALQSYRQAFAANPQRGVIEDKIARLVLRQAAHQQMLHDAEDLLAGRLRLEPTKKPAIAGVLSLVLPGLGQIYNERFIKGAALVCLAVLFLVLAWAATMANLDAMLKSGPTGLLPSQGALGALQQMEIFTWAAFRGLALLWNILFTVVWFYGVFDAVLDASRRREAVSTPTGPPSLTL